MSRPDARSRNRARLQVEQLETRLAPAALVNGSVIYTDVDGDRVTVTSTKPLFNAGNVASVFHFDSAFGNGGQQQLRMIDLTPLGVAAGGMGLTVTAVRTVSGGDGFANVGHINAANIDLGAVSVRGDLGQIDAGDGVTTTPGLLSLTVQSMGRFGTSTVIPGQNLDSSITGKLGTLTVKSDIVGAFISVAGGVNGVDGRIGSVNVGGSLIGVPGAGFGSGGIRSTGNMGTVRVGGNLQGSTSQESGTIVSLGSLASLTISGSIRGGTGFGAGGVFSSGAMGPVIVTGNIIGGDSSFAGRISTDGTLASATIGGSLIGGIGLRSGEVTSGGAMGLVKVAGDVRGGAGGQSGRVANSSGKLAGVTVGGALIGGSNSGTGEIASGGELGLVSIVGDIRGGTGAESGHVINFNGKIAGVTVGGSLIGGSNSRSGEINGAGEVGPIIIKGDVRGGSGGQSGRIGNFSGKIISVTIGGSLIGGTQGQDGEVESDGDLGLVTVTGNVIGAGGSNSGRIRSLNGKLGGVTINGSLVGGAGDFSGFISSELDMGLVKVLGDIRGGGGTESGRIRAVNGKLAGVTIGGSLIGDPVSTKAQTGSIESGGDMGLVKIGGNVIGGAGNESGKIRSINGKLAGVTIGGSLIGDPSASVRNGMIESAADMGLVTIKGDLRGGVGPNSGSIFSTAKIAGVTIGGSVIGSAIGFASGTAAIQAHGDIGPVKITGNVRGGAGSSGLVESFFGRIASVAIGGSLVGGSGFKSGTLAARTDIGPVSIAGDIQGAGGTNSGSVRAFGIAAVTIGGSLIGDPTANSGLNGSILSDGDMGLVKIGGHVIGGAGSESGRIRSVNGKIAGLTINGSLIGGFGIGAGSVLSSGDMGPVFIGGDIRDTEVFSSARMASVTVGGSLVGGLRGLIFAIEVGAVKIGRDIRGGFSTAAGQIFALKIASVTIGGSVIGGSGNEAGGIRCNDVGPVRINGDLVGGSIAGSSSLSKSGYIEAGRSLASVFIGGSIIAGRDDSTGTLAASGSIMALKTLGPVTVVGSLIGNDTNPVVISGGAHVFPAPATDVAIASLTVNGRVERANILGGYASGVVPVNADAQIGAVTVRGDWIASNLVAGAVAGADGKFGTADDQKMSGAGIKDDPLIASKITSLFINGQALGTVGGTDNFGIVAELIAALKIGGVTSLPLLAGARNDIAGFLIGVTQDLRAREI